MFDFLTPTCQVCGVLIGNAKQHQLFHDAVSALIRLSVQPDMNDAEWAQYVAESAEVADPQILAVFARGTNAASTV